ncbi:hypothetical protein HF086_015188 [Spodoptera exigua]|uniref:Sugar phosphate exchanger 3 n=1 Tax=Spodoptera exigua TaxID=7107 RepID=A0A922ST18_SPOEX|nr:hypothetical protein HF086_015188 [Spodoptera exigua]
MRFVPDGLARTLKRKYWRMSGINRDAPVGIQLIQKLSNYFCPRLQINRLRWYQGSVLVLTFFTYMTYHLTRKPISVVKSVLHQNCSALVPPPGTDPSDDQWCNWAPFNTADANTLLGTLDSAFLFSYAGAMFVSALFGRVLKVAGAGIAQTTGWPGTVAIVGKWFGNSKKGLIFGIWNSHTSLGNILGTIMAAEYVDSDWSLSFIYPGLVMGAVGGVVWLFLAPDPRHLGLAAAVNGRNSPSRQSTRSDEEDEGEEDEESSVVVGDQSASLRPNRYSANAAQSVTNLSARQSGELSTVFDVGGVLGAILAGLVADCSAAPALVCVCFYCVCAPMVSAAIGPMLAGVVSSHSWTHVFYMLIACNFMALFLLLRIAYTEMLKIKQERRMASPPRVRVE